MQTSENIGERIQNYLDGASSSTIETDVREILTCKPLNWVAFRALGTILESEGDKESATECYLGRIPIHVQKRFFKIEDLEDIYSDFVGEYMDSHPSETLKPCSDAVKNTACLAQYRNEPLRSASTGVARYTNARLWFDGYNTAVFNVHGKVDKRTLIGNIAPVIRAAEQKPETHIRGQAVLIGSQGSNNYYHWMTDLLPKFFVLEKSGIKVNKNTKYIFTNVTSRFQIDTLKHLGFRDEQIYCTLKEGENIRADELLVPILTNRMGLTMGSWLPVNIKEKFQKERSARTVNRKILVSRNAEKSHGRGIYNSAEFNQYFINKGYEMISPDDYTVAEQAQLFSQATHVAGPHGAGLTNLLFCGKGTQVYEFYGQHLAPCYWAISELAGLKYSNLNCMRNDQSDLSGLSKAKTLSDRRSSSFSVPLSELDSILV